MDWIKLKTSIGLAGEIISGTLVVVARSVKKGFRGATKTEGG